jgi:hypothetical protein
LTSVMGVKVVLGTITLVWGVQYMEMRWKARGK